MKNINSPFFSRYLFNQSYSHLSLLWHTNAHQGRTFETICCRPSRVTARGVVQAHWLYRRLQGESPTKACCEGGATKGCMRCHWNERSTYDRGQWLSVFKWFFFFIIWLSICLLSLSIHYLPSWPFPLTHTYRSSKVRCIGISTNGSSLFLHKLSTSPSATTSTVSLSLLCFFCFTSAT